MIFNSVANVIFQVVRVFLSLKLLFLLLEVIVGKRSRFVGKEWTRTFGFSLRRKIRETAVSFASGTFVFLLVKKGLRILKLRRIKWRCAPINSVFDFRSLEVRSNCSIELFAAKQKKNHLHQNARACSQCNSYLITIITLPYKTDSLLAPIPRFVLFTICRFYIVNQIKENKIASGNRFQDNGRCSCSFTKMNNRYVTMGHVAFS